MSLTISSLELANSILKSIEDNDRESLSSLFNEWFYLLRYNGAAWNKSFLTELCKNESNETTLKDVFNFKTIVSDIHHLDIQYILSHNVSKTFQMDSYDIYNNGIDFLIDYKKHIIRKHISSCVYNFYKITGIKVKNTKEAVQVLSKHSISGKIFYFENDVLYFDIPKNRTSAFIFKQKDFVFSFDVSISKKIDEKILVPHFIISQESFSNGCFEKFKTNITKSAKMKFEGLLTKYDLVNDDSVNKLKNISNNKSIYFICYNTNVAPSSISHIDYITMKFLASENTNIHNSNIPIELYQLIFEETIKNNSQISGDSNNLKRNKILSDCIHRLSADSYHQSIKDMDNKNCLVLDSIKEKIKNIGLINENKPVINEKQFKSSSKKIGILPENDINLLLELIVVKNTFKLFFHDDNSIKTIRDKILKPFMEDRLSTLIDIHEKDLNKANITKFLNQYIEVDEKKIKQIMKKIKR